MPQRKPRPLSVRTRIREETRALMKRRDELALPVLRKKLEEALGLTLRTDLILSNLIGMQGLMIDCETNSILKYSAK